MNNQENSRVLNLLDKQWLLSCGIKIKESQDEPFDLETIHRQMSKQKDDSKDR